MTATTSPNNEIAIFSRVVQPERADMSPEAAQSILKLDFDSQDRDRMNELAAKARHGALTPEEQQESLSYNRVGHLLALLQSKARRSLKNSPNS